MKWDIVATVNENIDILGRFVKYHKSVGCNKIFLFLDSPNQLVEKHFRRHNSVVCMPSIKQSKPDIYHEKSQALNAKTALECSQSSWIAHIDADEYIFSKSDIGEALSLIDDKYLQVLMRPWEPVYIKGSNIGSFFKSTHFRGLLKNNNITETVYPENHRFLKYGLASHHIGKSFVRTSCTSATSAIHAWRLPGTKEALPYPKPYKRIKLLHYDAISYEAWFNKLARRIMGHVKMRNMSSMRQLQLNEFGRLHRLNDHDSLHKLFSDLYSIDTNQIETLKQYEALLEIDINIFSRFAMAQRIWKRLKRFRA